DRTWRHICSDMTMRQQSLVLRAEARGSILAPHDRAMSRDLDKRLQYGPGMRVQRLVEAAFLIATFFSGDIRLAYVTLGLTALQALSPRLVPVAVLVAAFVPPPREHRLGDLYFDFAGTRGAC